MTYNKPEIVKVAEADAIQHGTNKGLPNQIDLNPRLGFSATVPAYEGDE